MAHSHGLILTWNSDLSRQTHTVVHRSRFCPTRPLSGPAPVRGFLPYLMDLVLEREINPVRCSIWNCRSPMSRKVIWRWISAAP